MSDKLHIVKVKMPRLVYDEIDISPCPICGGRNIHLEDDEENYNIYADENGKHWIPNTTFLVCDDCNLRADIKHWNKLSYKAD